MYYKSRDELMKINGWMEGELSLELLEIGRYENPGWLRKMLAQFPDADLNGDGELTAEEAVRYHASRVPLITPHPNRETPLERLPENVSHWPVMVPMRDGVELGTEVYVPAGEGPFPVLITRGARKGGQLDLAYWYLARGFACVSQDRAPEPEPERRGLRDLQTDAYDLVEWVARQSWCNGKTAMFGYSAGGMTTLPVLFTNPPSLTALITHISCTDIAPFWRTNGGVSRTRRDSEGGWAPQDPPPADRPTILRKATSPDDMHCFHTDIGGWFDPFIQGSLDDWANLKDTGKAVLVVGMDGHGWLTQPSYLPPDYGDADIFWPDVPQFDLLTGDVEEGSTKSIMFYFLMGDATDPDAPGNVWKVTDTWPLPHTPTSFYMTPAGGLQAEPVDGTGGALTYAYDPNDPVPMIGGANVDQQNQGPLDQRPLADRKDILRFATDPLAARLEVVGRISVEFYISTDVPDTTFMAKLVDLYPDGYEALITDSAVMARYHKGLYDPEPLQEGEVYALTVDLFSTALVFAAGHRIGLQVTSSNAGRYAVHPNSYEPVESYEGARIANNTVHVSAEYPSRLILPVIGPGVSEDYDPSKHSFCKKTGDYWK